MPQNYTKIDDLIKKLTKTTPVGKPKESEPISRSSEKYEIKEAVEHQPEEEVNQYVQPRAETIELPPDLKKMGLQPASTTQFPSYQNIKLPISDDKIISLTFHDGPNPKSTPQLLKILDDANVKATFFVVGKMVEKYPESFVNHGMLRGNCILFEEVIKTIITAIRSLRADNKIEPAKKINVEISAVDHTELLEENREIIEGLARLESLAIAPKMNKPANFVGMVVGPCEVFVDLAGAETIYRILSFIVAGVVLLVASYVYATFAKLATKDKS